MRAQDGLAAAQKQDTNYHSFADMKGRKVGTVNGFTLVPELKTVDGIGENDPRTARAGSVGQHVSPRKRWIRRPGCSISVHASAPPASTAWPAPAPAPIVAPGRLRAITGGTRTVLFSLTSRVPS